MMNVTVDFVVLDFQTASNHPGERHLKSKDRHARHEVSLAQRRVTVSVPATVANLGPGLEVVGMAPRPQRITG